MKRKMLLAIAAATLAGSALAATPAVSRGDAAKGKVIAEQVCAACHGADGNSVASANPSLAGQHAQYLESQLKAFKGGQRNDPIMMGMSAALSDADMKNVAEYFSTQKLKARQASDKTLLPAGQKLYKAGNPVTRIPACMACHGPAGKGFPAQYPALGSQHAAYIVKQLNDFKAGTMRKNSVMADVAMRMSDADMKAVAEYISGLR